MPPTTSSSSASVRSTGCCVRRSRMLFMSYLHDQRTAKESGAVPPRDEASALGRQQRVVVPARLIGMPRKPCQPTEQRQPSTRTVAARPPALDELAPAQADPIEPACASDVAAAEALAPQLAKREPAVLEPDLDRRPTRRIALDGVAHYLGERATMPSKRSRSRTSRGLSPPTMPTRACTSQCPDAWSAWRAARLARPYAD